LFTTVGDTIRREKGPLRRFSLPGFSSFPHPDVVVPPPPTPSSRLPGGHCILTAVGRTVSVPHGRHAGRYFFSVLSDISFLVRSIHRIPAVRPRVRFPRFCPRQFSLVDFFHWTVFWQRFSGPVPARLAPISGAVSSSPIPEVFQLCFWLFLIRLRWERLLLDDLFPSLTPDPWFSQPFIFGKL